MIGRLRGILAYKQPPLLMIDVQGVGYELEASLATFSSLPEVGGEISLYTHLLVREDAHSLYGFAGLDERSLFRSLLKVSGIGAKSALLILSGMDVATFSRCVQDSDTAALTRLPGIGKKTAERIVVDLRDRIGTLTVGPGRVVDQGGTASVDPADDAVSALIALGYKAAEASRMIKTAVALTPDADPTTSEELIRLALQAAVRG